MRFCVRVPSTLRNSQSIQAPATTPVVIRTPVKNAGKLSYRGHDAHEPIHGVFGNILAIKNTACNRNEKNGPNGRITHQNIEAARAIEKSYHDCTREGAGRIFNPQSGY
jgi:hypothetical protein